MNLLWIRAAAASVVLACRDRQREEKVVVSASPIRDATSREHARETGDEPIRPLFDGTSAPDDAGDGAPVPAKGSDFAFE